MRRRSAARPAWSRRLAPLPSLLALVVVVSACGSSVATPSQTGATLAPSPDGGTPSPSAEASAAASLDPAALYAQIEAQVEQLRELAPRLPVDPTLLDDATLKKNVAEDFAKSNPPKLVAANQRLLELMGLLPAGSDLAQLYVTLLGSQVAGYYDPDMKQLYLVSRSGALGPSERVTFAHEYTHALQDQNFSLGNLKLDAIGEGDASLAHLSLAEGDATLLMTLWAQAHLTPQEIAQLVGESADPEQTRILDEMPPILRESLLFPYTSGLQFVLAAKAGGGWSAVDAMFAKPPASTEQVLHPDKYASGEPPISVTFPKGLAARLGSGWTVDMEDTLGEFQLRVWLESLGGLDETDATKAAAGWGGDRVALVSKGDRSGAVIDTRWDSPEEAAEFAAAAQTTLHKLKASTGLIAIDGTNRVTIFLATDEALVGALASALGLAG